MLSAMIWRRVAMALVFVTGLSSATVRAQVSDAWQTVPGGDPLTRGVDWDNLPGVTSNGAQVTVQGQADPSMVLVDRYGPRIDASRDFRIHAVLQTSASSLGALAVVDQPTGAEAPAEPARVEVGLQNGNVVVQRFDSGGATAAASASAPLDASTPLGPSALDLAFVGGSIQLEVAGQRVAELPDPHLFTSGRALFGVRVEADNELSIQQLIVQAPGGAAPAAVTRCAPGRLLLAGSPYTTAEETGLYWLWPDSGYVRPIDVRNSLRSYLVAASPDNRWVAYYQRSANAPADRFVVDTWVLDPATDERRQLLAGNSPLGWIDSSAALVLSERPNTMVAVPSGELQPAEGQLAAVAATRQAFSPDGRYRALVKTASSRPDGVDIQDAVSGEVLLSAPTPAARGAVQLAWSPDSTRLAFTYGSESSLGVAWRLHMVNLVDRSVTLVEPTRDMDIHSVVWTQPVGDCS